MSRCSSAVEEGASNSGAHMAAEKFLHSGGQGYSVQRGDGGVLLRSASSASFGGNGFPVLSYARDRGGVAKVLNLRLSLLAIVVYKSYEQL